MPDYTKKAAKWARNTQAATGDYADSVKAVTDSPMLAAVAHQDALLSRFTQAVQSGQWAAATSAVPLPQWQQVTSTLGAQHLADGVTKGTPKQQKFWTKAGPIYNQIRATIRAMPNATQAQRNARRDMAQELMSQMKGIMQQ